MPVILMSGRLDKELAAIAMKAGANAVLKKPCELDEFRTSIAQAITATSQAASE
jgi:FixJ family two-component response regulator